MIRTLNDGRGVDTFVGKINGVLSVTDMACLSSNGYMNARLTWIIPTTIYQLRLLKTCCSWRGKQLAALSGREKKTGGEWAKLGEKRVLTKACEIAKMVSNYLSIYLPIYRKIYRYIYKYAKVQQGLGFSELFQVPG